MIFMFSFLDSQTTNSNENIIQCQGNQSFRTNRPRFLEAKGRSRDAPPLDHSPPQRFPHVHPEKKEQPQMVQRATGSPKNSYPVSFPTKEGPILRFLSATKVILKNAERIWPCKLDHLAPHPQTSYYEYGNGVVFAASRLFSEAQDLSVHQHLVAGQLFLKTFDQCASACA